MTLDISRPYAARLRNDQAAEYLSTVQGLPISGKTLRNWRVTGKGPRCRYLGPVPLYDRVELDRWAEESALSDVNPISGARRLARAAATTTTAAA